MNPLSNYALAGAVLMFAAALLPPKLVFAAIPGDTAAAKGAAVHYTISSPDSDVRFLVHRAGLLAALGHNHVIRALTVHGDVFANPDFALSRFALVLPVGDFRVDARSDRAREGPDFARQPSKSAVSGTRDHMLGASVLDAAHYPRVSVRSVSISGSRTNPVVQVRMALRGTEREMSVPISLEESGQRLLVRGSFDIHQSDFNIKPFAALGGALKVADTVEVRFVIVAERVDNPSR